MNKRVRGIGLRPKSVDKDAEPYKPKRKYPSLCKNVKKYFREYTENTSLHGVRYLGQNKRSVFERVCWTLIFVVSLYLCVNLIVKTYNKWDISPVIVSFAQSPTPVWQIPFPAITICPQIKSRQSVFNFTDLFHKIKDNDNYTEEDLGKYAKVALLCDRHIYKEGNKTTDLDTIDFFQEVAQDFNEIFWTCIWNLANETCESFFNPILTEEGICYTFNMLDRDDIYKNEVYNNKDYLKHGQNRHGWTLEKGYQDTPLNQSYPRRGISSGTNGGLVILMRAYEKDLDYICKGPVQGFKILLHHPGEIPLVASNFFRAPLNQEMIVAVKPDMMSTSDGLRHYDPHRRHCYFGSERELRFYKNYTQQNCEVECVTNRTLEKCGCVEFHMPHNDSTPICGTGNTMCVHNAKKDLSSSQVEMGINSFEQTKQQGGKKISLGCDCLPACTTLTYNAETSQADFEWLKLFQAFKIDPAELPGVRMTRVTIFFKEMQFITSERNELYGVTDFLASCGGLLGLFIGFSFISGVEIFYFLTLRLMCNIRHFGKHYWSGDTELINNDSYLHNK